MNVTPLQQSVSSLGVWSSLPFFTGGQFAHVCQRLSQITHPVWPRAGAVFMALQRVQPCDVRVVMLGQDPYPQPGLATGLAFAVPIAQTSLPRSLSNILNEVRTNIGHVTTTSDLTWWARQGVLLLNSSLTVPAGQSGKHLGLGWSPLIRQVLACLAPRPDIAWFMCGYHAKQRLPAMVNPRALVITTGHPSRRHLFNANRPFSRINQFLGSQSINW